VYPFAPVPVPPAPKRRTGTLIALLITVVLAVWCGLGDAALAVVTLRERAQAPAAYFFGDSSHRSAALAALLNRRAAAVTRHDEAAFLADVDQTDPSFVRRERAEYQNLVSLGLSSFSLTLTKFGGYPVPASQAVLARRYDGAAWTLSVTVRYAIAGLDSKPVAEPWVPIFGIADGKWLLAGESSEDNLPTGAGGLPWESKAIVIKRSAHVVAVVSADDQEIAPHLLSLAERGLAQVLKVRPTGWAGKVLVTAVDDRGVFQSYFRGSPDKLTEVAAIAVPTYSSVEEWDSDASFVTTRVVFNPETLGDGDVELVHDLAHEFTHAAMGPLTNRRTPLWLVEGFAEYVGYRTGQVNDVAVGAALRHIDVPHALPSDDTFYDSADNYLVAWLVCRLIGQRYGQAKLLKLYAYFNDDTSADLEAGLRQVLGVSLEQFNAAWQAYLAKLAG
jgi:hypothetical protein